MEVELVVGDVGFPLDSRVVLLKLLLGNAKPPFVFFFESLQL